MKLPLFLHAYNSPFKPPQLKWYFGKIAVSVPYFLPRKWIKFTYEDCVKSAEEHLKKHPKASELVPYDNLIESYRNYTKAVPLKVGFSSCGLGYKTKWSNTDYRHEWNPIWSFVCFGYQIALIFRPENDSHYWKCFLYWFYNTDKSKSAKERIEQCKREFPQTWTRHTDEGEEKINYYDLILKKKYL